MPAPPTTTNGLFTPILARTLTSHANVDPVAFDCVKLVIVRAGNALLFGECGTHHIGVGDVAVLAPNTLCGARPEKWVTTTTLYLDPDYMVDLVFWQHSAQFNDRRDATEYLDINYAEPAQVVRIGIDRARLLAPWLDDLAKLSEEGLQPACFYRAQSLLSSILDVVVPHIVVTGQRVTSTQRHTVVPSAPRHRDFQPLRSEARKIAEILASELHRRWSVPELASVVHLSPSQLRRVFSDAYGKAPIAYLTMLRAEQMARLLKGTDLPISAIAASVGWGDADFAARQFRRAVGVSPREFRRITRSTTLSRYPD